MPLSIPTISIEVEKQYLYTHGRYKSDWSKSETASKSQPLSLLWVKMNNTKLGLAPIGKLFQGHIPKWPMTKCLKISPKLEFPTSPFIVSVSLLFRIITPPASNPCTILKYIMTLSKMDAVFSLRNRHTRWVRYWVTKKQLSRGQQEWWHKPESGKERKSVKII